LKSGTEPYPLASGDRDAGRDARRGTAICRDTFTGEVVSVASRDASRPRRQALFALLRGRARRYPGDEFRLAAVFGEDRLAA